MKENIKDRKIRKYGRVLFFLYLLLVIYFMFFAENLGRNIISEDYRYNLTPFKEINRFRGMLNGKMWYHAVINLTGNVICFIPIGLVLPLTGYYWKHFHRVFVFAITFSLMIEFTQLVCKVGSFDVDDIILNTIGGIVGYIIYKISRKIYRMGDKR